VSPLSFCFHLWLITIVGVRFLSIVVDGDVAVGVSRTIGVSGWINHSRHRLLGSDVIGSRWWSVFIDAWRRLIELASMS
jgi:hypothetical protein